MASSQLVVYRQFWMQIETILYSYLNMDFLLLMESLNKMKFVNPNAYIGTFHFY